MQRAGQRAAVIERRSAAPSRIVRQGVAAHIGHAGYVRLARALAQVALDVAVVERAGERQNQPTRDRQISLRLHSAQHRLADIGERGDGGKAAGGHAEIVDLGNGELLRNLLIGPGRVISSQRELKPIVQHAALHARLVVLQLFGLIGGRRCPASDQGSEARELERRGGKQRSIEPTWRDAFRVAGVDIELRAELVLGDHAGHEVSKRCGPAQPHGRGAVKRHHRRAEKLANVVDLIPAFRA